MKRGVEFYRMYDRPQRAPGRVPHDVIAVVRRSGVAHHESVVGTGALRGAYPCTVTDEFLSERCRRISPREAHRVAPVVVHAINWRRRNVVRVVAGRSGRRRGLRG